MENAKTKVKLEKQYDFFLCVFEGSLDIYYFPDLLNYFADNLNSLKTVQAIVL